ncbi:MAG: phosphoribosylformylglycinamidine synthase, purS protein [Bdellovibrionales bacterium RBG_16_40_8]|nr:MAG: phosphoribosylformylglycinamidine synthase, purS protein [Bdellovibrionales bacterium RBG_16_40_8]
MKIGVRVMPRKEVLDSQGRAVERTLRAHGKNLSHCRVGKYIELEIDEKDRQKALAKATEMCEFALHNPLIETYELEVL